MNVKVVLVSGFGAPDFPKGLEFFYSGLLGPYQQLGYKTTARGIHHAGLSPIEEAIDVFEHDLLMDDDGSQFILFGHSKGGLVVSGFANRHPERVQRVKLLAAPWHGTLLARTWIPIPGVRVMSAASRWLSGQHHHELAFPAERVDSFFTLGDLLVLPATRSIVKGGNNVMLLPRWSEWFARLLLSKELMQRVQVEHGLADHLFLPWHPAVRDHVQTECAALAANQLVTAA